MHQFFAKSVACNEAPENKEFKEKHSQFVWHQLLAKPESWNYSKKNIKFKKKIKKNQNHEGSYNLGKTFWNPKKLLISSMEKKHQLCALLESGIGGLRSSIFAKEFLWENQTF